MEHSWKQPSQNLTVLCEEVSLINTMQFRQGDKISEWPMQLVILQIALVNAFKLIFHFLLRPFGEQTYVPQIMGAIALGPSFLGQNEKFYQEILYAPKGVLMVGIFRAMAFMFLLFLLSMRIDFTVLRKCGKKAVIIGLSSLIVPMFLTTFFAVFLREFFTHDLELYESLPSVAILVATTSFHVVLVVLTDLRMLNSELGRLALSSAMISGLVSWLFLAVVFDIQEDLQVGMRAGVFLVQISKIVSILIIVFICRPIFLWMVKKTPDGKPLKEPFVCTICLMVLAVAFFGEITGQHFYFAPVILGMAIPDGPPIVSSLIEKLDCFVETVLVPCYVIDAGRRTDFYLVGKKEFAVIEVVMLVASLTRLASVVVPALCFKMPFLDAVSLGFLLNCKGLFDVQLYSRANKVMMISDENYAILVINSALHSALFTWLARVVYDPSRRYIAYKRRTILNSSKESSELRVLACVHHQDNVPQIISILEDSNPTRDGPIEVYVMNLKQSVGGTVPLLIPHQLNSSKSSDKKIEINRITNAFYQIEKRNEGLHLVQCFTSYAPNPVLHDSVCSMAVDKTASFILIPFQFSDDASVRLVNKNILQYSPCSVGLIYDSGKLARSIQSSHSLKRVCVFFLGGPDDRETLAYSTRMAMNVHIKFTLVRLISDERNSDADLIEKTIDSDLIDKFRTKTAPSMNGVKYLEYNITEGSETAKVLKDLCKNFELILAGRRHDPQSALLSGLSEWREIEELGVVGDMLASSDFDCNAILLVIQQQATAVQDMDDSPRIHKRLSITDLTYSIDTSSKRWSR